MDYNQSYVDILENSLVQKKQILMELVAQTERQSQCIRADKMERDLFNDILEKKGRLIEQLEELDDGFEKIYQRIKDELFAQKDIYRASIQRMQKRIQEVTDLGVRLQALERKNKEEMEQYLRREREGIRSFHVNSRSANSYYQNKNAFLSNQTHFFDQKK